MVSQKSNVSKLNDALRHLMADTYALYLKTQNYHWHVKGPHFAMLHGLFEDQYKSLAEAVDQLAERLRILGTVAPASFQEFDSLTQIQPGKPALAAMEMVKQLGADHLLLSATATVILQQAQTQADEFTVDLMTDRIAAHQKAAWILNSHLL
jgi:starvation-inducible DNA-binding protein